MVFNWLFRLPQHHKYDHLWKEPLKDPTKKIAFFVDGTQSSFYQTAYFNKTIARIPFLLKIFSRIEFWVWTRLNRLSRGTYKVFFDLKHLNPAEDIVFSIAFTGYKNLLHTYAGIVLVHLTHYQHHTEEISHYIQGLQHAFVVAESDLTTTPYFQHYFPEVRSVYQLPLSFYPGRFKNVKSFHERINKCFASGSMSVPSSESYIRYYGKGAALNPMREIIYRHKESLSDCMEVYIFPHDEALKDLEEIKPSDGYCVRFAKKHLPVWLLKLLLNYELPYFRFDIVEKYNEYQFFISPEEQTGLPSMKLLEGILCGAVLVGIDDPMYTAIGFQDGVHYVAYKENDLRDLKNKIHYYQSRPRELEAIAKNGYALTMSRFTPDKIISIFWKDLEKLSASFRQGSPVFISSFKI
jgi:glycosyltransferase involved in cell wall biosynthesis